MKSNEFVLWLKGFTDGVHEYNITPKQWDLLKEKLGKVDDDKFIETPGMFQVHPENPYPGVPIGDGGWGIPNTGPVWQHPHYVDPYKITCSTGSFGTSGYSQVLTTTGTNPISYTLTTGSATVVFNPPFNNTVTYVNPISGSWSYTTISQPFTTQTDSDLRIDKKSKKRKPKSVSDWEEEIDLGGHE